MVRSVYVLAYAALVALGEALVARPAALWLNSQGLFRTLLAWDVPMGAAFLAAAAGLAALTFALAVALAFGKKPRAPAHLALLCMIAFCIALRAHAGDPRPPRDPLPSLLAGLRAAAERLDELWAPGYAHDAGAFASAFDRVPPTGFRRLSRPAPLHVRILSGAAGAQSEPLAADEPGTIYVAISLDRSSAWLTALGPGGIVALPSGKPALIEARGGTHSLPGRDPLVPAYPGRREGTR